ncbi:uncharacterized protein EI90DRAFT_3020314 [Cantharellus anzutake]|uniref:uncharacterized protein n=1 Tax=Cantharellus anzutake TaxID=1750568 RepID=UPI001906311F|nr:uncharacterized protein EI90DRAFT_3020314 [Cantharellus anzutake]KAF8321428.1 hypothetical protein EI90DRAFT_3020314 [Cantharellus anzutake]
MAVILRRALVFGASGIERNEHAVPNGKVPAARTAFPRKILNNAFLLCLGGCYDSIDVVSSCSLRAYWVRYSPSAGGVWRLHLGWLETLRKNEIEYGLKSNTLDDAGWDIMAGFMFGDWYRDNTPKKRLGYEDDVDVLSDLKEVSEQYISFKQLPPFSSPSQKLRVLHH